MRATPLARTTEDGEDAGHPTSRHKRAERVDGYEACGLLSVDVTGSAPSEVADGRGPLRYWRVVLLAAVVLVALWYAAGWALADRLPRGTVVEGVPVGGLSPESARAQLERELSGLDDPVTVVAGDRRTTFVPGRAGLILDLTKSVDQVPRSGRWSPLGTWRWLVGGESHQAVVITPEDQLERALSRLAAEVARPARDGKVDLTPDGAVPTWPRTGSRLDVPAAARTVEAAYPRRQLVELPVTRVAPEVTRREVTEALERFAEPALSKPVTYRFGRQAVTVPVSAIADLVSMAPGAGGLEPRVDIASLVERVQPALTAARAQPVPPTVRIRDGRPVVVPGTPGAVIDAAVLERSVLALLTQRGGRSAEVPTEGVKPEPSVADVQALGIREVVSEFTTFYPHAAYRNVNVGRAAELVDGTIVEPGETCSLNETVGERTRANGFTEGFVISDGVFKEDLGGGVSQLATTTSNAAFFAGLEDVEHKPHSFYIDRYPMGREATVAWPTIDLRFRNDTAYGVLMETRHSPSTPVRQGAITVRLWSTKVWDIAASSSGPYAFTPPGTRVLAGPDCVPNEGGDGFQVDVTRAFRRAGDPDVARVERFHTTYIPADTVVCTAVS